jgi:thioredoxin-like negative regulator of GroEL
MIIKVSSPQTVSNFNTHTKKGYWIVLYYADWCPHCQMMKPEWNKFVDQMKSNRDINVAEIESQYLDKVDPSHKTNIQGFPSIISCNNGKKITDFSGPRTSQEITSFANNNVVKNNTNKINNVLRKAIKKITKKTKKTKKSKKSKKSNKH